MTLNLPERVASLHELTDDDHRALYLPEQDGDGYRLSRPRLAAFEDYLETAATLVAEHATAMAEREAQHQRRAARLRAQVIAGDARQALRKAGARLDLMDAATALFIAQTPLRIDDETSDDMRVVLDDPGSFAGVDFMAVNWLDSPAGRPYRAPSRISTEGAFARALRLATEGRAQ